MRYGVYKYNNLLNCKIYKMQFVFTFVSYRDEKNAKR